MTIPTIGFIGLGTMGTPMARNISKGGYPLVVYDINEERVKEIGGDRPPVAASCPREVGEQADICITMVPTPEIVRDIVSGADGLFAGMKPGTVWIDMSTSDPVMTRKLGEQAAAAGIRAVDAPVARSSKEAETGRLMIMTGGEASAVEMVRPVLERMGSDLFYCGPLGNGHTMKLVNNLLGTIVLAANSEALVLGSKSGLSLETMLAVLSRTNVWNGHLEKTMPASAFEGQFEPGYKCVLAEKDLGLAKQLARHMGVPLFCGMTVREMLASAIADGHGDEDFTAIIRPLERQGAVEVRVGRSQH